MTVTQTTKDGLHPRVRFDLKPPWMVTYGLDSRVPITTQNPVEPETPTLIVTSATSFHTIPIEPILKSKTWVSVYKSNHEKAK